MKPFSIEYLFHTIAKAYLTAFENRNKLQLEITKTGICNAVQFLSDYNLDFDLAQIFKNEDLDYRVSGFFIPIRVSADERFSKWFTNECDIERGMFCLLLSEIAENNSECLFINLGHDLTNEEEPK